MYKKYLTTVVFSKFLPQIVLKKPIDKYLTF